MAEGVTTRSKFENAPSKKRTIDEENIDTLLETGEPTKRVKSGGERADEIVFEASCKTSGSSSGSVNVVGNYNSAAPAPIQISETIDEPFVRREVLDHKRDGEIVAETTITAQNSSYFPPGHELSSFAISHKGHFGRHCVSFESKAQDQEKEKVFIVSFESFLELFGNVSLMKSLVLEAAEKVARDWNDKFGGESKIDISSSRNFGNEKFLYCPRKIQKTKNLRILLQVTSFHFNSTVCRVDREAFMKPSDAHVLLRFYCTTPIYGQSCYPKGGLSFPLSNFVELLESTQLESIFSSVREYAGLNPFCLKTD